MRWTLIVCALGCASPSGEPSAELTVPPPVDGKADGEGRAAWVAQQIEVWNEHLEGDVREEKLALMRESPYVFFRATNHLFWSELGRDRRLSQFGGSARTRTFLQGDVHPENFGAFDDDGGEVVYGLNDFDEAVVADYQLDVWRLAVGMVLLGREQGLDEDAIEGAVHVMAEAYLDEQADPTDLEAYGEIADFIEEVEEDESRAEMLEEWTVVRSGRRTLNLGSDDLEGVPSALSREITAAIPGYGDTLSGGLDYSSSYFRVKSVARRLHAGAGSLGAPRFYVLIEGPSASHDDDVILDVKRQDRPTGWYFLSSREQSRQEAAFESGAERVVRAQRALLPDADDHLGWLELSDGSYSVRARSPFKKTMDPEDAASSIEEVAEQWGTLLARSHARADRDFDRSLVSYQIEVEVDARTDHHHDEFRELVWTVASAFAEQVETDYAVFAR
jgi:uncharacterized protein (DUF2252 family)